MAHDVFISHSPRDRSVADDICLGLEATKIRCWSSSGDIGPGTTWAEATTRAIETSRVFILVFSRTSNKSDDVFRETSLAASWGIPIVTFRIDRAKPTRRMEYYLKPNQWVDATDPRHGAHIQDLTATVQQLLNDGPR
jgi:hypothetical protein